MLKLYKESDEFDREIPPLPVITTDDYDEYEVETILDKRTLKNKVQYLVKWVRYPLHDATWEPVKNCGNAIDKINEFELTRTSNFKEGRM